MKLIYKFLNFILDRAEALQSIMQLMGEKEMYEYWSQDYRVHNLDWSQEKAAQILDAWQRKFTRVKTTLLQFVALKTNNKKLQFILFAGGNQLIFFSIVRNRRCNVTLPHRTTRKTTRSTRSRQLVWPTYWPNSPS